LGEGLIVGEIDGNEGEEEERWNEVVVAKVQNKDESVPATPLVRP
jgi:hypothetical protein